MRQNLALSALILVTMIPVAATGLLGLAAVVAVHEAAELVVILNGVRAGRRVAAVDVTGPLHVGPPDGGPIDVFTPHRAL